MRQEALATELGFKDRQILSAIELGDRRISAIELATAADVLGVEVEYFTDAFRLDGEGSFSFRADAVDESVLHAFEQQAGRWVATYRELKSQAGIEPQFLGTKLNLTKTDSYEKVEEASKHLRAAWQLGKTPSATLENAIRRELDALILHVDAPAGISGAATYLPGLHTIIINRNEAPGRRAFDLAHELFHLLTWDAMPPNRVESTSERKGNRIEQLANIFAAALLMPDDVIAEFWSAYDGTNLGLWLNQSASRLGVTAVALKWHMVTLKYLVRAEAMSVDDASLVHNGAASPPPSPPPFNDEFVRTVHAAVDTGRLSLRRAAKLLGVGLGEFSVICQQYGLAVPYAG